MTRESVYIMASNLREFIYVACVETGYGYAFLVPVKDKVVILHTPTDVYIADVVGAARWFHAIVRSSLPRTQCQVYMLDDDRMIDNMSARARAYRDSVRLSHHRVVYSRSALPKYSDAYPVVHGHDDYMRDRCLWLCRHEKLYRKHGQMVNV